MDELHELRTEIDQCDEALVEIFQRRMELVTKVLEYKKKNDSPIFHGQREQEIIEKTLLHLKEDDYIHEIESFLKEIFKISKGLQYKLLEN